MTNPLSIACWMVLVAVAVPAMATRWGCWLFGYDVDAEKWRDKQTDYPL